MEEKCKPPSLPSNYVTIVQLQERWLKQKELEEQQSADQQLANGKKLSEKSKANSKQPTHKNRLHNRDVAVSNIQVAADKIASKQEIKIEELKEPNKKKNNKGEGFWKGKKKHNDGGLKKAGNEEKFVGLVIPMSERKDEKKNKARGKGESRGMKAEMEVKSESLKGTVEIESKIRDLSTNNTGDGNGKGVEIKPKFKGLLVNNAGGDGKRNGGLGRIRMFYNNGNQEFGGYHRRRPRNDGIRRVWVKKGEISDGNVGVIEEGSESIHAVSGDSTCT